MNNEAMMDKLIKGTQATETVTVMYEDEAYDFTIKPLTSKQLNHLQRLERRGIKLNVNDKGVSDIPVSAEDMANNMMATMVQGVSYGLDIDKDKAEQLPNGILEQLFNDVLRVSSVSDDELLFIKSFRKQD